jgi:hypothetical protein
VVGVNSVKPLTGTTGSSKLPLTTIGAGALGAGVVGVPATVSVLVERTAESFAAVAHEKAVKTVSTIDSPTSSDLSLR